jgi:hypothetical protein
MEQPLAHLRRRPGRQGGEYGIVHRQSGITTWIVEIQPLGGGDCRIEPTEGKIPLLADGRSEMLNVSDADGIGETPTKR